MIKLHLITLREAVLSYQARKRAQIENREERNSFNGFIYLSKLLGYKDEMTTYKFCNQSSSKTKMSVEDFEKICIETLSDKPAIDLLQSIREGIEQKKEIMKNQYQYELTLL